MSLVDYKIMKRGKRDMKNTIFEMEMNNGEKVKMTLNFASLYKLSNKNRKLYLDYNSKITKGISEELDNVLILYTAYCCANVENDNIMSYDEFLELLPISRQYIGDIMGELLGVKKK